MNNLYFMFFTSIVNGRYCYAFIGVYIISSQHFDNNRYIKTSPNGLFWVNTQKMHQNYIIHLTPIKNIHHYIKNWLDDDKYFYKYLEIKYPDIFLLIKVNLI